MYAVDKVTKRIHAICPVFGGYQVCLIPDTSWEEAKINEIYAFLDEQFEARFALL